MSGRVTLLGLSRWAGKGGSYRSVQRFCHTAIPWAHVMWHFFRAVLWRANEEYLLVGDESVVSKAGRATHGLDRFFSSLYGKPIRGLAFVALALVSVQQQRAYPMMVEQRVRRPEEKAQSASKPPRSKERSNGEQRRRGRPKGSRNKDKRQIEWTAELRLLHQMLVRFLALVGSVLSLRYFVLDGHFGHNSALQMVRQHSSLHLISKLRHDAAFYLPDERPYSGRGPRRKYGPKLRYDQLPERYLKRRTLLDGIQTDIYQATLWHKSFAQALNVVLIVKTNLATGAYARVILFSSDLDLAADTLIAYYRLRFQIEFNFRDAKQYWGLEDFMTIKPTPVINAANLSLLMVNIAHALLDHFRRSHPAAGVIDLKADFRGRFYAAQTLNLLPQPPEPILMAHILDHVARLGCVHPDQHLAPAA